MREDVTSSLISARLSRKNSHNSKGRIYSNHEFLKLDKGKEYENPTEPRKKRVKAQVTRWDSMKVDPFPNINKTIQSRWFIKHNNRYEESPSEELLTPNRTMEKRKGKASNKYLNSFMNTSNYPKVKSTPRTKRSKKAKGDASNIKSKDRLLSA